MHFNNTSKAAGLFQISNYKTMNIIYSFLTILPNFDHYGSIKFNEICLIYIQIS